jgi:alpha-N-arabinofuranosidase
VEIGNEDSIGRNPHTYGYRWPAFYNALSPRYPNITFIATTFQSIKSPAAFDDHFYQVPLFYLENFRRYENTSRPSVKSAVAEAVFRSGFERNSDIMIGGCYAPVLQNIDYTQWTPNLIVFNASLVVKTTSYLVHKMFGENLGNIILNSSTVNNTMAHQSVEKGLPQNVRITTH